MRVVVDNSTAGH